MSLLNIINVTITEEKIQVKINKPISFTIQNTINNIKMLIILLRFFKGENQKPLLTFQNIADLFGYKDRRNVHNYWRKFKESGNDFLSFLQGKVKLIKKVLPLIEKQILEKPLLSISKQYRIFNEKNPKFKISETYFRECVKEIDSSKLLKKLRKLLSEKELYVNGEFYIQELLDMVKLDSITCKEIVTSFENVKEKSFSPSRNLDEKSLGISKTQQSILMVILYGCGLSMNVISVLFGCSKTTVHNCIHLICTENLESFILSRIVKWSGRISFDEKYVKIKKVWHFILSGVDAETGFPLFMKLHPSIDYISWGVFFKQFRCIYGKPKLILSDGSQSLLKGLKVVFPGVVHQLCKFHKLKNLLDFIYKNVTDSTIKNRCIKLSLNIFRNKYVSSRKFAARSLKKIIGDKGSKYVDKHILNSWKKLSKSLTNNPAERNNRRLKKGFSNRYGINSIKSGEVLLRAIWFKELCLNGSKHLAKNDAIFDINISKIFLKSVNFENNIHFLPYRPDKNYDSVA